MLMQNRFTPPKCSFCCDGTRPTDPPKQPECGSPRQLCPHCGKEYYDNQYAELALQLYDLEPEKPEIARWLSLSILLVIAFASYLKFTIKVSGNWLYPIILAIVCVICITRLSRELYTRHNWKKHVEKFHNKIVSAFDNVPKSTPEVTDSLARLSDEEYLYYLLEHGVEIPEYFFRRIHCFPDLYRLEDAARKHQATQNYLKTVQKYYELNGQAERYKEFLLLSPECLSLRKQAELHGMSPLDFKTYCQKQLERTETELNELLSENNI